eukprot:2721589-Prymnesium_polylepis.1
MVYFTKGVLLTIAVVLGSLLTAGYLHPEEHIGDRCAVLFIAFLIPVSYTHLRAHETLMNL